MVGLCYLGSLSAAGGDEVWILLWGQDILRFGGGFRKYSLLTHNEQIGCLVILLQIHSLLVT